MTDRKVERKFPINRAGLSEEGLRADGTFRITLATDDPIDSPFGRIALSHQAGAAHLPSSIPLQIAHNLDALPVGKITRLGTSDGRTQGTVTLSRRVRDDLAPDIIDGIVTDVSVGALIRNFDELDDGTLLATHWEAVEGSLVARGADPAAKIHRSLTMSTTPETTAPVPHETRVSDIRAMFNGLDGPEWVRLERDALASSDSVETLRDQVVARLKSLASTPLPASEHPAPSAGLDAFDKYAEGFSKALELRSNLVPTETRRQVETEVRQGPFLGLSMLDAAREYLRVTNTDTVGMNRDTIARTALHTTRAGVVGHSAGDFTQLLAANVNKSLAKGYDEAPETWQTWTGMDSAPDFKQAHRPVLSAFSDLEQIYDDGEYRYGTFSDKEEVFTIERWGKLFSIGRTAIVNDDLSAFSRIPRAMGRAASRKVGDEVYNVLSTGHSTYTMNEDSVALFHAATHSNYVASGSGAAISVATLNTARAAMATQTEQGGHTVRILPRYLISAEASIATAETIVAAAFNPATASGQDPMPQYIGLLQTVSDPRIDADTSTKWYLAADPGTHDTVLVAFLDGISTPTLEEHDAGPSRDGIIYKVRHEFDVYAGDWRTLYLNWGA